MDDSDTFISRSQCTLGVFKTVYLFLQNNKFLKTAESFKKECDRHGRNIDTAVSRSLLLKKCKCANNQANQTEPASCSNSREWLETSFEVEPHRLKNEDTHVVYVCDHCQQTKEKVESFSETLGTNEYKQKHVDKIKPELAPKTDFVKLKSKFSQLQDEHKKLIAVTSELTTALQMNIIGQTRSIHSVLEQCKSIYPSLFVDSEAPSPVSEYEESVVKNRAGSEIKVQKEENSGNGEHFQGNRESSCKRSNDDVRTPQIEQLNVRNLSPRSNQKTPLTPETVRQILETVFDRIFELERTRRSDSPPLKKEDVEKIVNDVIGEVSSPPNLGDRGGGEGSINEIMVLKNCEKFFDIDYERVKRDLMMGDNEKKIRILQALRWRITKNESPLRAQVMDSYVTNDVLDLFSEISIPERLLAGYNGDGYVQESSCRLINALASLRQGRDYLTLDERLLKRVLIKKVKDIRNVSSAVIRNMLVASVQKLSIRNQCRTLMVNEGLFEVMVDYLDEFYEKLSRYCLEYCSALLMNLCLVDEAKQRSTKSPKKVIGLIRKFLEGEHECCLPYINGVMFSLLEKEEIVREARNQNLDKLLIRFIRITTNENIRKQLDFIVQSRLFGKSDPSLTESDEDSKEEVDLLEIELDQDDFITHLPSGEKLLEEYKAADITLGKPKQSTSFSILKREVPSSAKSFCEDTKQFYHKPSAESGIFERNKTRRFACNQGLIRNFVKNKKFSNSYGRLPSTPLCYMESCQRQQEGNRQCSCTKCVPGQNRFSCGCYDAIFREIAEDDSNHNHNPDSYASHTEFGKVDSKNSQQLKEESEKSDSGSVQKIVTAETPNEPNNVKITINQGGRNSSGCRVCGEKKCDCAFEPRPKLCRTPTL